VEGGRGEVLPALGDRPGVAGGRDTVRVLAALSGWGSDHRPPGPAYTWATADGRPVRLAFIDVDADGRPVDDADVVVSGRS
jgi:hypothetical protein